MIGDIDKYVDLLCKLDINEHQFLILWLVSTKDEKNINIYKHFKGDFSTTDIEYLIEKGYLNDFGIIKDGIKVYNIYNFMVTDLFNQVVVIDKDDAFEELVSVYPSWFKINNTRVPAKGFGDELIEEYHKVIKSNRIKHEKIVKITKEYHEKFTNGFAQKKLSDYIKDRMWILYEERLNENSEGDIGFKIY